MTDHRKNQQQDQEVTLRSPDGTQTVRSSDPNEIREYENNGYERVEGGAQR